FWFSSRSGSARNWAGFKDTPSGPARRIGAGGASPSRGGRAATAPLRRAVTRPGRDAPRILEPQQAAAWAGGLASHAAFVRCRLAQDFSASVALTAATTAFRFDGGLDETADITSRARSGRSRGGLGGRGGLRPGRRLVL